MTLLPFPSSSSFLHLPIPSIRHHTTLSSYTFSSFLNSRTNSWTPSMTNMCSICTLLTKYNCHVTYLLVWNVRCTLYMTTQSYDPTLSPFLPSLMFYRLLPTRLPIHLPVHSLALLLPPSILVIAPFAYLTRTECSLNYVNISFLSWLFSFSLYILFKCVSVSVSVPVFASISDFFCPFQALFWRWFWFWLLFIAK